MPKNKIKIAIIQQSPDLGGAETYTFSLINEFNKCGVHVFLATNKGKFLTFANKLNINVYKIPITLDIIGNLRGFIKSVILFIPALFYYIFLLYKLKSKNIDVILMSGFSEKILVTFLSIFFKIPVVWIEYSRLTIVFNRNFGIPRILYSVLGRIAKKIVVPTNYAKKWIVSDANISKRKFEMIPLGVKISNKHNKITKNKKEYTIGNISRLTKEKGQQYLIGALPYILTKIPSAKLLLVGSGPDELYFRDLARKLNIENHVQFTGFVDKTDYYFGNMDVFIFPTVWNLEGFGLVSIEAMSHKVPVIASNIHPVDEVVSNAGMLVKPRDKKAIAEAVINVYKNPEIYKRYANAGYKSAIENFNIKKQSRKLLDVLVDISKNKLSK